MRKTTVISLAVILFGAPLAALAENQPFSFFGKMDVDLQSVRTSQPGAGIAASRARIASNASGVGVKGSREIGRGLQAFWQISTRVNLNGAETGGGGGLFTLWGNSHLGIKGDFGTVFMGVWDTPFRQAHDKVEMFGNTHISSPVGLLGNIGNGIGGATTVPTAAQGFHPAIAGTTVASTGFNRRQKSALQYWSPSFQHIQLKLAYSVDDPGNKTTTANPALLSVSAAYDGEPLYLAVAHERHQDLKVLGGANIRGTDTGIRLVAAYQIGDGKIGMVYERLSFGTTGSTSRNAVSISGAYRFGDSTLGAVFTRAGDLTGTTGTGADQFSLRYGYMFAEGAEMYGQYTLIRNRANGTYNFADGLNIATAPGARLSGLGMGMAYVF